MWLSYRRQLNPTNLTGMTVNDTTNSLTTRIIFGKNKKPQNVFNYRNMGVYSATLIHSSSGTG